ncbi:MAG TPA: hypothetical protein VMW70_09540 [Burkholderiales bacterium]|nr:hypothetical protein [Burkholderiales bacterium]
MRRSFLAITAAVFWASCLPAGAADGFSGSWEGPWYRGMTSGTMILLIETDGSGVIEFTNLDNFGEETVELSKVKKAEDSFGFSASGAGPGVFVATTELISDGKVLKGKGEYEGFPIKFKLKRR